MSSSSLVDPLVEAPAKAPTNVRYGLVLLLALASLCAYLPRVCLGTANTTIQREFDFSSQQMGWIMSAFSWGYLIQVPAGALAKRWGTRLMLSLFAAAWSACAVWTGLAFSYLSFLASRALFGLGQAGLVPCSAKGVRDWAPPAQHGIASSSVASAMTLGSVIAASLTAFLMPVLQWRGVFFVFAAVGLLWAIAFYAIFRNRPEEHPWVNESEARLIRTGSAAVRPEVEASAAAAVEIETNSAELAGHMCRSREMWMLCLQAFCRAFGAALFITWFAAYLEKGRGVDLKSAGLLSSLPLIGILAGNLLGGPLVDRLLVRHGRRLSRCGVSGLALVFCAVCYYVATLIPNTTLSVIVVAIGSACFGSGSPAGWAATMDISGKHTALVFGIMNTVGNVGGLLSPIVVGQLIGYIERTHGDWNLVLYLIAAMYVLGAVFWALLDPERSAVGDPPRAATA
ncbi:MAG: MFS transporter [Actinomycetota bacterium]